MNEKRKMTENNNINSKILFTSIDKNNFGYITKNSLEEYLNTQFKLSKKYASNHASQLINLMSKKNDIDTQVNYNEFSKFISKQEKEILKLYKELTSTQNIEKDISSIENGIQLNHLTDAFQNTEHNKLKKTQIKGLIKTIGNKKDYISLSDLKGTYI